MSQYNKLSNFKYARFHFELFWLFGIPGMVRPTLTYMQFAIKYYYYLAGRSLGN